MLRRSNQRGHVPGDPALLDFINFANVSTNAFDPAGRPIEAKATARAVGPIRYGKTIAVLSKSATLRELKALRIFPNEYVRPGTFETSVFEFQTYVREAFRRIAETPDAPASKVRLEELPLSSGAAVIRIRRFARGHKLAHDITVEVEPYDSLTRLCRRFFDALQKCGDAKRIRICPICGGVYWADRTDKKACSKQCSNTLRQQEFRNRKRSKE